MVRSADEVGDFVVEILVHHSGFSLDKQAVDRDRWWSCRETADASHTSQPVITGARRSAGGNDVRRA